MPFPSYQEPHHNISNSAKKSIPLYLRVSATDVVASKKILHSTAL